MAKLTWLGEGLWPSPIEWNGVAFPLGQPVEVADPAMIRKASANPRFKVEDDPPKPEPKPEPPPPPPPVPEPDEEEDEPRAHAKPKPAAAKPHPRAHVRHR